GSCHVESRPDEPHTPDPVVRTRIQWQHSAASRIDRRQILARNAPDPGEVAADEERRTGRNDAPDRVVRTRTPPPADLELRRQMDEVRRAKASHLPELPPDPPAASAVRENHRHLRTPRSESRRRAHDPSRLW